jgi:hypothetical protein
MIVLFLVTVAGKMFSFPTVEAKAFFTLSSILLCLRGSLVLVLVILALWVVFMSEIAGLS